MNALIILPTDLIAYESMHGCTRELTLLNAKEWHVKIELWPFHFFLWFYALKNKLEKRIRKKNEEIL